MRKYTYTDGGYTFERVDKRAGFKTRCNYGKHENYYNISMEV